MVQPDILGAQGRCCLHNSQATPAKWGRTLELTACWGGGENLKLRLDDDGGHILMQLEVLIRGLVSLDTVIDSNMLGSRARMISRMVF